MRLMYPVDACPLGSMVWARMRMSPGGWLSVTGPWQLSFQAYAKPLTGNLATTPYLQEATQTGTTPVEVTVDPTPGTWSAWVTIMDESAYDMLLTGRVFSVYSFNDLYRAHVQWAIHDPDDAPIEANVVKDEAFTQPQVALGNTNWLPWENPYFLNSGLRVSCRVKTEYETFGGPLVSLTYVRFVE